MDSALFADRCDRIRPFQVMRLLKRARELEAEGREIIHMEIGEPDFSSPPAVVEAGIRQLRTGTVKYTASAGIPELRRAIAGFYSDRYKVSVDPGRIFITPGGSGGLLLAFAGLVNQGERILIPDPGYPCNRNFISLFDAVPVPVAVDAGSAYHLDPVRIREHWSPETRGVLISSPSNPTGTLIPPEEFHLIIELVESLGGLVISDEIYHGLEYGRCSDTALKHSDGVIVVNSFSKFFGMTGWRVGWIVVPDDRVEIMEKLAQTIYISAPSHSQYAALASFDAANMNVLESRRQEFAGRRDYLVSRLSELGFDIAVRPEGAFYVYAGCSRLSRNSFELANEMLEKIGVAVTPGLDFGANRAETHVRFAYTTSMPNLRAGIARISKYLGGKPLAGC